MPTLSHMPWIAVPNGRLRNPDYLNLNPTSRAVLIDLSYLMQGDEQLVARVTHIAGWIQMRVTWVAESLKTLEDAGFISVSKDESGTLTIKIIGSEKLPSRVRLGASSGTPRVRLGASSVPKESRNDAGFSDSPLYIDLERDIDISPLPPKGKAKAVGIEFDAFWSVVGKRVDRANAEKVWAKLSKRDQEAAIEGMRRQVKRHKAKPEFARDKWQYFKGPATWLRARAWEDEQGEELSPSPVPPAPSPKSDALVEWRYAFQRYKQEPTEECKQRVIAAAKEAIKEDARAEWLPAPHNAAIVVSQWLEKFTNAN